ncbi:transcription repressor OFP7-like [Aristolochia californica]|uniref:transcription repressor OFP7-like n=1 Tax=Aristolochia californica TaxID=171875 RepID=UPI0035DBF020
MAKRLKQKISRVFPSFQSCRSKDPASLPENPVPVSVFCLSPVNPKAVDTVFPVAANPHPRRSFRHLSTAVVSVGCGCRSARPSRRGALADDERSANEGSEYRWQREEKWHVVAPRRKIDYTDNDDDTDLSIGGETRRRRKKKTRQRRKKSSRLIRIRFSTSSADSEWFSSEEIDAAGGDRRYPNDDDDETETLFSPWSFTTDSSQDYNPTLKPIREAQLVRKRKPIRRVKMGRRNGGGRSKFATPTRPASPEMDAPARVSVFRRLIPCSVDGKVKESFAVVKRSEDPYEDFRRSMLEMIMEKQMFNANDLEQLLHCFLSLNAEAHHGVIVEAFSEIWEILFCKSSKLSVSTLVDDL